MSIDLQQAIRNSIQTEKSAMDFYLAGAAYLKDQGARRMFELLAAEEREHAGHYYRIYQGTDIPSLEAFLDAPPDAGSSWLATMRRVIDDSFTEKEALELAMLKEKKLAEFLAGTAAQIADPAVREVFELNARETHNHYLLIEAEYARIMGMVDESDMDAFVRE
ncbi:ferritin-like domain-containing protein [Trichlorobacter lovleyi]|uniref:Rubrerythrin n=1 Tax=Trichlorobacter lovleyi (strain ATCC BAA-1151 / DSM 17278 / SZ) TaxID=398767 RepID=B3E5R3_TRIL1|nr:ferritin family protein [Trichlorobacter lovleyi]ACD96154.1 Rubrerythrin [Trichlorobacter lovleyi SZ]